MLRVDNYTIKAAYRHHSNIRIQANDILTDSSEINHKGSSLVINIINMCFYHRLAQQPPKPQPQPPPQPPQPQLGKPLWKPKPLWKKRPWKAAAWWSAIKGSDTNSVIIAAIATMLTAIVALIRNIIHTTEGQYSLLRWRRYHLDIS